MQIVSSPVQMRALVEAQLAQKHRVGVVPTMGALHEGHLSLVRRSKAQCQITVATIFVNPTQFGPNEDFSRYPRTLDEDLALLKREGVDLVFCPTTEDMYPPGFSTYVEPPAVSKSLEGEIRPGHFRGVCTVVLKLLEAVPADFAFFGQKDYQQALVIQHMVRDFHLRTAIAVCPIVRDADGLALSSRNRYLTSEERTKALGLSQSLKAADAAGRVGERSVKKLSELMKATLRQSGVNSIDYVAIADRDSLAELDQLTQPAVALIAARVGNTRLIDNALIDPPSTFAVKE